MKTVASYISLMVDAAIAIVVVGKFVCFVFPRSNLNISLIPVFLWYVPLAVREWRRMRSRMALKIRKCCLLGPTWVASMLLAIAMSAQLYHGCTKEMAIDAEAQQVRDMMQWWADVSRQMKMEALLFAMLSATVYLHGWRGSAERGAEL